MTTMDEEWNSMTVEERRHWVRTERTHFCKKYIDSIVEKDWDELDKNTRETLIIISVASR